MSGDQYPTLTAQVPIGRQPSELSAVDIKATTSVPGSFAARDIRAEESMAHWAEVMVWVTVASLLVAFASVWGLIAQIGNTRRTRHRLRQT